DIFNWRTIFLTTGSVCPHPLHVGALAVWRRHGPLRWKPRGSVVVVLPSQAGHGARARSGPLRRRPAGPAPGRHTVGVGPPVPADGPPGPTGWRAGVRSRWPALGVVFPRLAAAVRRHVQQPERRVGRFVATARRRVRQEHAVAVAQVALDVPLLG